MDQSAAPQDRSLRKRIVVIVGQDVTARQNRRHPCRRQVQFFPSPCTLSLMLSQIPAAQFDPLDRARSIPAHYLGPFSIQCLSCHALHWLAKRRSNSTVSHPTFSGCCKVGDVDLPLLNPLPRDLCILYDSTDRQGIDFR